MSYWNKAHCIIHGTCCQGVESKICYYCLLTNTSEGEVGKVEELRDGYAYNTKCDCCGEIAERLIVGDFLCEELIESDSDCWDHNCIVHGAECESITSRVCSECIKDYTNERDSDLIYDCKYDDAFNEKCELCGKVMEHLTIGNIICEKAKFKEC